jgi:hypothetical protein
MAKKGQCLTVSNDFAPEFILRERVELLESGGYRVLGETRPGAMASIAGPFSPSAMVEADRLPLARSTW